jgi:hypothetical protein
MKKTGRKLQLSRETLHQLIADPSVLGRAPGGDTAPSAVGTCLNSCQGASCPPVCTLGKHSCVG